jgi:UDP-N-acetylglucosamine 2-epimerase (non-hydrolysing)
MSRPYRIICVVAARPNLVKMAPLLRAPARNTGRNHLVHSGQHYDVEMDGQFFDTLQLQAPAFQLAVGSKPSPSRQPR